MPSFVLEKTRSIRLSVLSSGQIKVDLPDDSTPDDGEHNPGGRYDVDGVCRRLGISRHSVRNLMRRKLNPLPHTKPGGRLIFWEEDVLAWEKQGGVKIRQASVFHFPKL